MAEEEKGKFLNRFLKAAKTYNHNDVKACENIQDKVKEDLLTRLDFKIRGIVDIDNFKFIISMACMLGGKMFAKIPEFMKELQSKN